MMEWFSADKIAAGIVGAAGIIWAVWERLQKARLEKANVNAGVAIADSQKEVYEQMRQRLADMQADVSALRMELNTLREQVRERDNKIHALEMHIKDLEHLMRQKGIEPPPFRR